MIFSFRRRSGLRARDSHGHFNDHRLTDVARASLMVKAPRSPRGHHGALRKGEFYACSEKDAPKILIFDCRRPRARARIRAGSSPSPPIQAWLWRVFAARPAAH